MFICWAHMAMVRSTSTSDISLPTAGTPGAAAGGRGAALGALDAAPGWRGAAAGALDAPRGGRGAAAGAPDAPGERGAAAGAPDAPPGGRGAAAGARRGAAVGSGAAGAGAACANSMTFRVDCARAVPCPDQQRRAAASNAGPAVLTMTFITYASHCLSAASPPLPGLLQKNRRRLFPTFVAL